MTILKQGTAGVSYYGKCQNNVQLTYGSDIIVVGNAKIRYGKVRLGSSIVQKAKLRHNCGFNLFKKLKQGTAGVLYCGKC